MKLAVGMWVKHSEYPGRFVVIQQCGDTYEIINKEGVCYCEISRCELTEMERRPAKTYSFMTPHYFIFVAVQFKNTVAISCGCHSFSSIKEAKEHWGKDTHNILAYIESHGFKWVKENFGRYKVNKKMRKVLKKLPSLLA